MPLLPKPKEQFQLLKGIGSELFTNSQHKDKVISFIRSCEKDDRISCFHEDPHFYSALYKYFKEITTDNNRSHLWNFNIKSNDD